MPFYGKGLGGKEDAVQRERGCVGRGPSEACARLAEALWDGGSFSGPRPRPCAAYSPAAVGEPQWLPLGLTQRQGSHGAVPRLALSMLLGRSTWLLQHSQAAPFRVRVRACLHRPPRLLTGLVAGESGCFSSVTILIIKSL